MSNIYGPICHSFGVRGYGCPDDGVVIVGLAPGRDEVERSHRPFTGVSGKLLDKLLGFSGWSRDRTYCTNTLCWENTHPTEHDLAECEPRLRRELHDLHPKLIITAGAVANEAVMSVRRRKGSRGSVVWSDYWRSYVLDTHHPSFALQSQSMSAIQDIIRDLSKIPDILKYPPNGALADVKYSIVESLNEAQRVLDDLPRDSPVALDIETSNPDVETVDAYTDKLLCFSITHKSRYTSQPVTYVFPTKLFPDCIRDGSHIRTNCKCGFTLNFPLDIQWLFQAGHNDIVGLFNYFGVRLPLVDDTMLLSMCTDERPGYHGLKGLAREYLCAGWYDAKIKPFYKGKMHLLKPEDIEEYNAKDSNYTFRLEPILLKRAQEDDMIPLYRDLLLPATNTFIDMQIRGINVDQKRLAELAYLGWFPEYLRMYRDLQLEAQDIGWPTDDINLSSIPQLRRLFFDIFGVEVSKLTPKGKPSLDKETLDRMTHPFAAKIRAFRTLDTAIDYVFAVQKHLKPDGLLHPQAFVSTTRTGRTSYRDPALQTIPQDYTVGTDYARLREIFTPHNLDTHCIVECDFAQIEVWIAWAESQDPTLLEHLQSGDVHSYTAEIAFDTRRELWTPLQWQEKRQNAKKIRFGLWELAEVKPTQLLETLRGNQQPGWLGIAANGSETDSTTRTAVAAAA